MKPWTENETDYLINNYNDKTLKQLAKELDRSFSSVNGKRERLNLKKKYTKEYALYKGDNLLVIGTIDQISDYQGLSKEAVRYLLMPSYKKKVESRPGFNYKYLIELED